jgi:hypothetical protein
VHVRLQRPHCRIFDKDLGSSVYPLGVASPFFRSLPVKIPWVELTARCAHPLDDGTAVMLGHSIEATAAALDASDRRKYRSLIGPLASESAELSEDSLWPISTHPTSPHFTRALRFVGASTCINSGRPLFHRKTRPSLFCPRGKSFRSFIRSPGFSRRWLDSSSGRSRHWLADSGWWCSNSP